MLKKNYVGIIILNYSTYNESIALVEALQKQTIAKKLRIVIVDNASPNDSFTKLKPLKDLFENVVAVLQTGENLGYAQGNNFGLKYLEENVNTEYVAILNNDVILPNDCFEKLIDRYTILENPAIITPVMVSIKGERQIYNKINSFWNDIEYMFVCFRFMAKSRMVKGIDNTGHNAMKVEVISGSFMFANFNTFQEIGFFYPNTFLYAEERFVAHKAKVMGYNNYVLLDQEYIHNHSTTINAYHNLVSKHKMLYDGYIKFAEHCRSHGRLKAAILKLVALWSLCEWRVIELIKRGN